MKFLLLVLSVFGLLSFLGNAAELDEVYSDLRSQFEALKAGGELYSSKTLSLGIKIKAAMDTKESSVFTSNLFNELKKELPLSVQVLAWSENTHIFNRHYSKEYLYAHYDGTYYDSNQRRVVWMWTPGGRHEEGQWEFSTEDNGETFKIKNIKYKEFLYAAADSYAYDSSRRRVFTWQSSVCNGCEWFVEIISNDEIRLRFKTFDEYFYAGEDAYWQNYERRNVFTWRPSKSCDNTCVWRLSPEGE
jgi:hypothetical protein